MLRSTLPNDARATLTAQLGAALQQNLGQLGAQRASDIAGINTQLGQLGIQRVSAINDLASQLQSQDLAQKEYERQLELARLQASGGGRSSGGGGGSSASYFTRPSSNGGVNFYDPNGNPITAAQYFNAQGGTMADVRNFLTQYHPGGGALKLLDQYNRGEVSLGQLKSKYPYVFGGV